MDAKERSEIIAQAEAARVDSEGFSLVIDRPPSAPPV